MAVSVSEILVRKTRFPNLHRVKNLFHKLRIFSNNHLYTYPFERVISVLVHILAIFGMSFMILDVTLLYKNNPTVTTPETNKYPIQNINYPAVAICNINRISRRAMIDLAEELLEFESTRYNVNLTVNELTEILKFLGHLYLFDKNDGEIEKIKLLHTILERGYNGYNVARIMRRLTPKCRHMLRRCSWEGRDQSCDDIFFLRRTENGYCCTFNYARQTDGFGSNQGDIFASKGIQRMRNVGSDFGLSVLLNPLLEDYTYKLLPNRGFKILIYPSLDYPATPSGGVREILISPRTENFLNLDAVTFYSVPEVKQYDVKGRDCLFNTENSKIFHGHYSFTDCIMHCRIADILHLCKCIPFFYPIADDIGPTKTCDLKDLSCLKRYRDRWQRLKPWYGNAVQFDENKFYEKSGYLSCDCLPSCEDISYSVSVSKIPLSTSELYWSRFKYTLKDHSILHVYFGKSGTVRLRQDVLFYWYELMSNYGGICSLFLGISIINIIEILYKLLLRFWQPKESRFPKTKEFEGIKTIEVQSANLPKLYWNEITGSIMEKDINLKLQLEQRDISG